MQLFRFENWKFRSSPPFGRISWIGYAFQIRDYYKLFFFVDIKSASLKWNGLSGQDFSCWACFSWFFFRRASMHARYSSWLMARIDLWLLNTLCSRPTLPVGWQELNYFVGSAGVEGAGYRWDNAKRARGWSVDRQEHLGRRGRGKAEYQVPERLKSMRRLCNERMEVGTLQEVRGGWNWNGKLVNVLNHRYWEPFSVFSERAVLRIKLIFFISRVLVQRNRSG